MELNSRRTDVNPVDVATVVKPGDERRYYHVEENLPYVDETARLLLRMVNAG